LYDTYGADAANGRMPQGGGGYTYQGGSGNMGDFSDFFQTLFGNAGPARGNPGGFGGARVNIEDLFGGSGGFQRPAQDVEGAISVPLTEAFRGTTRTVDVGGKRLEVNIPRGARDGQKMRLRGQAPGGANVILTIRLESDPTFRLEGDDVRVTLDVPAPVMVIGGKLSALTLEGRGEVNIPPRSQAGRVLRLRGQGWVKKDGSRGDALLELRVTVPKEPSAAELELWETLMMLINI
jgi:curved DNA-binding protein